MRRLLLALVFAGLAGCGETHVTSALRYTDVAIALLIERGVCDSQQACIRKEMVFWRGGGIDIPPFRRDGVKLDLYRTSDPILIDEMIGRLRASQLFEGLAPLVLTVSAGPHSNPGRTVRQVYLRAPANKPG